MIRLLVLMLSTIVATAAFSPPGVSRVPSAAPAGECFSADPSGPAYYSIDLISTKRVPGSRAAEGVAAVTYAASPFGISLAPDGSYALDLSISVERLAPARDGAYVVWITKPDLSAVNRLGALGSDHRISGHTQWNKFLVVISLEPDADRAGERWTGPIVLRGMSRSGKMHTMAGHGPFQAEPCAVYGYR